MSLFLNYCYFDMWVSYTYIDSCLSNLGHLYTHTVPYYIKYLVTPSCDVIVNNNDDEPYHPFISFDKKNSCLRSSMSFQFDICTRQAIFGFFFCGQLFRKIYVFLIDPFSSIHYICSISCFKI